MYPFLVLVLVTTAFGHMEMTMPYALRSKFDPANKNGLIDYSNTSPLLASMYMNCAQVEISNGSTNTLLFDTLPDMYVANVNRGCSTVEGRETVFNNPGVDVVYGGKVTPGSPPFPNC
ncbi:hypothetical protein CIHG_03937 [Coccidioides immitis H538.4]|uniref:Uncharacterized protein n=1 Tax=Coccidioides immitis H538.4 TaxID=396776 RepID=A0A0J8RQA0_COCIT|nr:hypothetical protein CIHG_03937 [Coccidioides immitis H538.4]